MAKTDMFSQHLVTLNTAEFYSAMRRFLDPRDHLTTMPQRPFMGVYGPSGVGKTAISLTLARMLNDKFKGKHVYKMFVIACNSASRHVVIPAFSNGVVMKIAPEEMYLVEAWLAEAPENRAIMLLDEILSCEQGFQPAMQPLMDKGHLGSVQLTHEQFMRLHIIATGNASEDGNPNVQADKFFFNRFAHFRFQPDRTDFLNSTVETGIVYLHPLVTKLITSEVMDKYWNERFGPHEVNPRTLEAVSQVCEVLADPMTGMLPTPDSSADSSVYREMEVDMAGLIPMPIVVELLASNEAMKGLTPINDIVLDPSQAALPAGGPLAEILQAGLIDNFLRRGDANNIRPWRCIPHMAVYAHRLSAVVQPTMAKTTVTLRDTLKLLKEKGVVDAKLDDVGSSLKLWRDTMVATNLSQKFEGSAVKIDAALFQQSIGGQEKKALAQLTALARGNPLLVADGMSDALDITIPDAILNKAKATPTPQAVITNESSVDEAMHVDELEDIAAEDIDMDSPVDDTLDSEQDGEWNDW